MNPIKTIFITMTLLTIIAAPPPVQALISCKANPESMMSAQSNLPAMAAVLPSKAYPVFAVGKVEETIFHLSEEQAKKGAASSHHYARVQQLYLLTPERVVHLDASQYPEHAALRPTSKAGDYMPLQPVRWTDRMRRANAGDRPKLSLENLSASGQWLYPVGMMNHTSEASKSIKATGYAWQPCTFALPVVFSDPGPKGDALQMVLDEFQTPHSSLAPDPVRVGAPQPSPLAIMPLHAALDQLRVLYFKGSTQAAFAASLAGQDPPHRLITNAWLQTIAAQKGKP